jgi:hypothetical protein
MKPVRPLKVLSELAVAARAARYIRGFTLAEVSAGTGIPVWQLVAFERGSTGLEADDFGALWKFLSDSPRRLVLRDEEK